MEWQTPDRLTLILLHLKGIAHHVFCRERLVHQETQAALKRASSKENPSVIPHVTRNQCGSQDIHRSRLCIERVS